eukprot:15325831-Heterocapsa_arctica.AAC.1
MQSGRQFEPPVAGTMFRFESPFLPDDPAYVYGKDRPNTHRNLQKSGTQFLVGRDLDTTVGCMLTYLRS